MCKAFHRIFFFYVLRVTLECKAIKAPPRQSLFIFLSTFLCMMFTKNKASDVSALWLPSRSKDAQNVEKKENCGVMFATSLRTLVTINFHTSKEVGHLKNLTWELCARNKKRTTTVTTTKSLHSSHPRLHKPIFDAINNYCLSLFITVYCYLYLFITVYVCLLQFMSVYCYLRLYITVYVCILLFISVYYSLLLYIAI